MELETVFAPSAAWLGQGGVHYDDTGDLDQFDRDVQRAHLLAVDPGDPCGVACFGWDLAAYGVSLHEVSPEALAFSLVHVFPDGLDLDLVCERPLSGAMRVYDSAPLKVRGFLELWHQAQHRTGGVFVSADVGWLKAGRHLAHVTTKGVSQHARDALAYGVMATMIHPEIHDRLLEGP